MIPRQLGVALAILWFVAPMATSVANATDGGNTGETTEAQTPPQPNAPREETGASESASEDESIQEATVLPPIENEVNGTCQTPRQAWLQLLYWLQPVRYDPIKASVCVDKRAPTLRKESTELVVMLKDIVDAKGALIDVNSLPTDSNYTNSAGLHHYEDPMVVRQVGEGIELVKIGKRWVFSERTLRRIPGMYPYLAQRLERMLPQWLKYRFFGAKVWSYIGVIVLIFLAITLQRLSVFFVGTYIRRLVAKTDFSILDQAMNRADRPIGGLAMSVVFYLGFPILLFPARISQLALVATEFFAMYSVVWLSYRLIDVLADFMQGKAEITESKLDDQLVPLITKTLKVFASIIGALFILQNLNVNVGSLLAGLGLGGLAFALAAKDTIANLFGSVMIFIDKPFQIGDWVVISGTEGVVEEVGFRTSRVRTFYNSLVTVPNATVVNSMVDNYGARRYRRYVSTLGITYDTPPAKVQAFCEGIRAIIAGMPGMRKDYYLVEFKGFGAHALEIMLYCFMESSDWNAELRTRTNLNLEIMRLAEKIGVSFAFPTQTIHVSQMATEDRNQEVGSEALAEVVDGFGPGGKLAKPLSPELSRGYDCGSGWEKKTD